MVFDAPGKRLLIGGAADRKGQAQAARLWHTDKQEVSVLPQADFVALTCPLTAETERLINVLEETLARLREAAPATSLASEMLMAARP